MIVSSPQPFQTQGGFVYEAVGRMIVSGELPYGTPFTLREMATRLGVSVTPVRDAVNALKQMGLVEKVPRGGYRVVPLTRQRVLGYFAVRRALLAESARLAAERITDEQIPQLARAARTLDAMLDSGNFPDISGLDSAFHAQIAEVAGLPFLAREIGRLATFEIILEPPGAAPTLDRPAHLHVLEAITSRDPNKADAVMRAHVDFALQRTLDALDAAETST